MRQRLVEPAHMGTRVVAVFDIGGDWVSRVAPFLDQLWKNLQKLGVYRLRYDYGTPVLLRIAYLVVVAP